MKPVHGGHVGTPYGRRGKWWSLGIHKGADFPAPKGTPVRAPWSGRVVGIGSWGPAFGNRSPVIDFDRLPDGSPGLWGILAHLDTVTVKVGDRVKAGDVIGTVGTRGNVTGPHVHFEIQRGPRWSRFRHRNPAKWIAADPKGLP